MLDAVLSEREKRSRRWYFIIALAINIALMVAIYITMQAVFEGPDDTMIAQFVNGSSGSYDPHIIYSNYILGVIWCALYRVLPGIAWYSWSQYVLLCLSFTGIMYVLLCRIGRVGGFCFSVVTLCFAAYEFYVNVQYTKTAAVLTVAGFLLIFHAITEAKISWRSLLLGLILSAFAVMLHCAEFFGCLLLLTVGIGFWLLFHLRREVRRGKRALRLLRWILVFVVMAAISVGLIYFDRQQYTSPKWQAYLEYNETQSNLFAYGLPDYQQNKDVYEELNIDEEAYNLYNTMNAADTEKLNVEAMQRLIALREEPAFGYSTIQNMLSEVPAKMIDNRIFLSVIAVAVLWILWGRHDRGTHFALILECAAFFALYSYLFYEGRYLLNRVDAGLWFAFQAVLLWSFRPDPVGRAGVLVGELPDSTRVSTSEERKPDRDENVMQDTVENAVASAVDGGAPREDPEDVSMDRNSNLPNGTYVSDLKEEMQGDESSENMASEAEWEGLQKGISGGSVDIEDFDYEEAIDEEEPIERKKERSRGFRWFMMLVRVVCVLAVLVVCVQYEYPEWMDNTRSARSEYTSALEQNEETLLETSADVEHLYITKVGLLSAENSFAPFDVMPKGCLVNTIALGGWRVGTDQYNAVMEQYAAGTNPYRALIGNEQVYLADDDIDATLAYLRTYYDAAAQASEVEEIGGVKIYQIVTGEVTDGTETQ